MSITLAKVFNDWNDSMVDKYLELLKHTKKEYLIEKYNNELNKHLNYISTTDIINFSWRKWIMREIKFRAWEARVKKYIDWDNFINNPFGTWGDEGF